MSLEKSFRSCSFAAVPVAKLIEGAEPSNDTNRITSFFVDSSGRSTFTVPLQMTFASQEDLDALLAAKCFDPPPRNLVSDEDLVDNPESGSNGNEKAPAGNASLAFEVKCFPNDQNNKNQVTIEGVSTLFSSVKDLVVTFKTEMTVRAGFNDEPTPTTTGRRSASTPAQTSTTRFSSSPRRSTNIASNTEDESEPEPEKEQEREANITTRLEITPLLTIENSNVRHAKTDAGNSDFVPDLMALELAAIPDHMQYNKKNPGILSSSDDRIHEARLSPACVDLALTSAFTTVVNSVKGPHGPTGNTLVSLTIKHSKTHNLPVMITNIAFHPGHSRYDVIVQTTDKNKAGSVKIQQALSNMTEYVEWGFAHKTELKLPLTLRPHDAYSTVIFINAGEERNSRQFTSPLSVTGVIDTNDNDNAETTVNDDDGGQEQCRVVVAGDVHWTTKLISVEPADAFRIEMCTMESTVRRGEPMVVKLRIFNLSLESRHLMLFMPPKKDRNQHNKQLDVKNESVNAAVVSESDGYTFGVWGISGEDDGTVRLNKDHDLLAIDTALVLGDVKGQHAIDAELRFVPLHLGRLKVPDWRLYDKGAKRWYSCKHDLNIVAV